MISDEERDRIVERIKLEDAVRRELAARNQEYPPGRWAWAESKLGLLLIGTVITGILIPVFQTTQETIKWARQNRYDLLKYRLESVRSSMKELVLVHTFVAEAFERSRALQADGSETDTARQAYRAQSIEMQNRRFQQNARFSGALGLLDEGDREVARRAFDTYLSSTQQLMTVLDSLALARAGSHTALDQGDRAKLQASLKSLNQDVDADYERVQNVLRGSLHLLEQQGGKYN